MDNEFPDLDEEFDLMHEDEYEVLRELEVSTSQAIITNNFTPSQQQQLPTDRIQQTNNGIAVKTLVESNNEHLQKISIIENKQNESSISNELGRKRSIDQISQNFPSDIFNETDFENFDEIQVHEKKRPCWDRPEELMQIILEKRKKLLVNGLKNDSKTPILEKKQTNSISKRVPLWNFVAVTRCEDGERFYIKVSDKNEYVPKKCQSSKNLLIKSFDQLKDEAEQIIMKNIEKASLGFENVNTKNVDCELWVDKYRPKRYIELLSDENVNRSLLYWLKLWDKIVFDRDPTVRQRKPQVFSKFKNKFKNKIEDIPDHDSKGFPTQRIALIAGSPGLGKTTLAQIVAKHAGYNIVEINASDDRGPEAFREALLSSTQMKSFVDKEKRPNCLILDEIDGAPTASIELLLKFIHGKLVPKGRNAKLHKQNNGCRRPIICICNDLYTPSLRSLRNMALVINVPEISPSILADRLSEIVHKEGINLNSRTLLELVTKSGCDVRACLGILQYTRGGDNLLQNLDFGLRNMRKGLFDSWKEMFQIPQNRRGTLTESARVQKVIKIVQQNEPDRLAQGIFHNYPLICKNNIIPVYKALQWFEFYDKINNQVLERQNWMLMPYTMSSFVAWHFYLAVSQTPKISFPTSLFEITQNLERNQAILLATKKVSKIDIPTLVTEVLPYLPDLLTPNLRSVNAQLYSATEKEELSRLVNLMLDFGLSFSQEKKPEGGYNYYLDPNIWNIGTFPDCKIRKTLSYAVKQIVIQELEIKRLQRIAVVSGEKIENSVKIDKSSVSTSKNDLLPKSNLNDLKTNENVPNHLRQLNPIELKPTAEKKCRNFFLSFQLAGQKKLEEKQAKEKQEGVINSEEQANNENKLKIKRKSDYLFKSDVWYQFKEGYSNAVRRTVLMEDLL